MKLLDTGIIYPIADSPWVSPIHCVPKNGGITVVANENDELVLTRTVTGWRNAHLVLNWEEYHFMVKEGIVLGHKVSSAGLEVDKAKINVISKLPPPTNIKAQALPTNDARVVVTFLKKLFFHFGMPKALISDRGTHFYNKIMERTMKRYGVNHRFSISYHPQTSGQVENTNRDLKRILEKTIKDNPAIWSRKLDDAL
ncbi:reverse transcriptase domain-containing protein [Tanacetum coccineum]